MKFVATQEDTIHIPSGTLEKAPSQSLPAMRGKLFVTGTDQS